MKMKTNQLEYIKQLEEENIRLKKQILSKLLSDNTEITRLNFKLEQLEKENISLKQRNSYLSLMVK